ncbi:MAG: hypothetical protein CVU43_17020 [Chloroflexi bacterium HGW-Chloroflexi-5]|jgi:hypothetical protein|nr:MAG: hypothetical protein CVU43_17020 [Chloroflexi bacterium HGW-Chloroflexi-5]
MRSKNIEISGKNIFIQEQKIKEIKGIIPKISGAWTEIGKGDIAGVVDRLGVQIVEIFPELKGVDIDECYPSELEGFVEAWIDVNFTGVKKIVGPLLSLAKLGQTKLVSDLAEPLDSQTTGKN